MEKPFQFRRSREIAGAFVLLAGVLLLVGIVLHGQIRGWFEPKQEFEVVLPVTGSQGLRTGSEVYILGNKAGIIDRIELRHLDTGERLDGYTDVPPNKIRLVAMLEVRGGMFVFVGSDSIATLKRDLGGFGSSFFEITRGHEPWGEGPRRLKFETPVEVQDELTAAITEIRENVTPALEAIAAAGNSISSFGDNLENEEGGFQKTLEGINKLVAQIDRGEGALGILLNDEQAKKDLGETLTNIKTTTEKLSSTVATIDATVAGMNKGEGVLGTLLKDQPAADDLATTLKELSASSTSLTKSLQAIEGGAQQFPETINKTDDVVAEIGKAVLILQDALSDIELVAEGLQNHWLVRGSVDDVKKDKEKAEAEQQRAEASARAAAEAAKRGEAPPAAAEEKKRGLFNLFRRKK